MTMLITPRTIVFFFWALAFVLAVVIISLALRQAWKGTPADMLSWRVIKAGSALLGLVGFFLLALNLEGLVRSSLADEAKRYIQHQFLTIRFVTLYERAVACAKDQSNNPARLACSDFTYLDERLSAYWLLQLEGPFERIAPWRPGIEQPSGIVPVHGIGTVLNQVNSVLESMQFSLKGFGFPVILNFETRFWILFFSLVLVLLAVGGSVGEAVYQLKQTWNQERAKAAAQAPPGATTS